MLKSFLVTSALSVVAIATPASALTIDISQSADTTDVPFAQTNQNVFLSADVVSSAVLNITNLLADDAVVVSLNGTALFGSGIFGPGNGNFFFTADGPSTPFLFEGVNGPVNVSFTGPFVAGNNVVTVTYNNNNAGINSGNGGLTGGPGQFAFAGTITAVPEPATWAMMIGGFGLVGAATRRRARTSVTYA